MLNIIIYTTANLIKYYSVCHRDSVRVRSYFILHYRFGFFVVKMSNWRFGNKKRSKLFIQRKKLKHNLANLLIIKRE